MLTQRVTETRAEASCFSAAPSGPVSPIILKLEAVVYKENISLMIMCVGLCTLSQWQPFILPLRRTPRRFTLFFLVSSWNSTLLLGSAALAASTPTDVTLVPEQPGKSRWRGETSSIQNTVAISFSCELVGSCDGATVEFCEHTGGPFQTGVPSLDKPNLSINPKNFQWIGTDITKPKHRGWWWWWYMLPSLQTHLLHEM